jgi:hypothetical protein
MTQLTNKQFAQQASFMAREISCLVGNTLLFEDADKPVDKATLHGFLSYMRERLDRMERLEAGFDKRLEAGF